MAELLSFGAFAQLDFDKMDRAQLLHCLEAARLQLRQLDAEEPADMDSEAYDAWGDRHEALEDLVEDLLDYLDNLSN